jgi:hypothetical protein
MKMKVIGIIIFLLKNMWTQWEKYLKCQGTMHTKLHPEPFCFGDYLMAEKVKWRKHLCSLFSKHSQYTLTTGSIHHSLASCIVLLQDNGFLLLIFVFQSLEIWLRFIVYLINIF